MTNFEKVLMKRDGLTRKEANEELKECQQRIFSGENPEDILYDDYGLEPDYVFDLILGFWYEKESLRLQGVD